MLSFTPQREAPRAITLGELVNTSRFTQPLEPSLLICAFPRYWLL